MLDKIIRKSDRLLTGGKNKKIILFYSTDQTIYDRWEGDGILAYKEKGVPSTSKFLDLVNLYCGKEGGIVIFDDLSSQVKNNISFFRDLFMIHSHHQNLSVFLTLHNIFTAGTRDLSLNCHRFIVTHNPRDILGIATLARQCFSGTKNFLPSVYKHIGKKKFAYLVLDFSQNTSDELRGT